MDLNTLKQLPFALLFQPKYAPALAVLVIFGDALLTQLIIRLIPYTEIDWETYMYQVELYIKGERNYAQISGPTGPLVYPAGHVYIHEWLYNLTSAGLNIQFAQQIYGLLYLVSQALSAAIYLQAGNVPNYVLLLLPLSKRLHSIYVLRLFNDCWAVVGAQAAVLALSGGWDSMACILFSLAISVKMSVLLYIPGLAIILLRKRGLVQTALYGLLMVLFQAILGKPFLLEYPLQYLAGAFDLSRVFLFKWTVNWRFLGEELFLSPGLAKGLLLCHLLALLAFVHYKWTRGDGGLFKLLRASLRNPVCGSPEPLSSDYIVTVLMTSNLIGIVFARSLHYQFYSWYAQQIPFLAWRTRFPLPFKMAIILAIEYAWNVFPSTPFSSAMLVGANITLLAGIWHGLPNGRNLTTTRKVE